MRHLRREDAWRERGLRAKTIWLLSPRRPEPEKVLEEAEACAENKANWDNKANRDNKASMDNKADRGNKANRDNKAAMDNEANAESSSEDDVDMDSSEDDDGGSEDIPRHTHSSANPSAPFVAIGFQVFLTILGLFPIEKHREFI